MEYDLFVRSEQVALEVVGVTERAYCVDTTERPDVYQFFNLGENELRKIRKIIKGKAIEIRDSSNGDFLWPNREGIDFDAIFDVPV